MVDARPNVWLRSLHYPKAGIDAVLAGAAHAYPETVALRDGDETLTYAEVYDRALRVAGGLRARGVSPGEAVALHMPNSIWFVVAYYGVLCAGAAVAPVNPAQPPAALRRQLDDCDVTAVITHPSCAASLADTDLLICCVPPTRAAPSDLAAPEGSVPFAELLAADRLEEGGVDPELVAHLQLTGGTTGVSKAVRVLQRNLVTSVLQVGCWRSAQLPYQDEDGTIRLRPAPGIDTRHAMVPGADTVLGVAPLFHGLGLVGQSINMLLGATVVISGRFDPEEFLADVERYGVTGFSGSPAMHYALLRSPGIASRDLSSVRAIGSGAAPIDTTALRRLREAFPNALVTEGYGLSEATLGLTYAPIDPRIEAPLGSVGVPLFDTEVQIRADDGRTVLAPGETGELWARGPQIAAGYHGHPELTAVQFVDGWLRTGDLGRIDENGFVFLAGRAKDMLIYKGYNVYPQALEEILCEHPAVAQAAVVGRVTEDVGEVPVGFVVARPDAGIDGDGLMAFVAERVAPYQRVREVHVVDALPLTATGKVLKTELRDRLVTR